MHRLKDSLFFSYFKADISEIEVKINFLLFQIICRRRFRSNSSRAKTSFCRNSTNLSYMSDDQYLLILEFSVEISISIDNVCDLCR